MAWVIPSLLRSKAASAGFAVVNEAWAEGDGDDQDPGLADVDSHDFRLRTDAPVFGQIPFRPIPVDEIGLYEHPLRASWPVETASGF
jgi:hypothetical protein